MINCGLFSLADVMICSKYKALESMMEEAFKSSMHIKEDKITALESRLDESKARNQRLQVLRNLFFAQNIQSFK